MSGSDVGPLTAGWVGIFTTPIIGSVSILGVAAVSFLTGVDIHIDTSVYTLLVPVNESVASTWPFD